MNEPVLRITASDGEAGSEYYRLLHQVLGYVVAKLEGSDLPFPFGTQITHLQEEQGTLVVRMDRPETALRYGSFLIDAWQAFAQSAIEFRFAEGSPIVVRAAATSQPAPARPGASVLSFRN